MVSDWCLLGIKRVSGGYKESVWKMAKMAKSLWAQNILGAKSLFTLNQSCHSAKMKYRDQKKATNTGSYTGYFEGGIRGNTLKIASNTGGGLKLGLGVKLYF